MTLLPKSGVVIFAKDVGPVARFYEELLSMTATKTEGGDVVLESASFQIVVHTIPSHIAKSIELTSPPTRRTDVATKTFFPVGSLAAARIKAVALGGELNPESKEFEVRGFRACDGHDPEGNVVQFRENAA